MTTLLCFKKSELEETSIKHTVSLRLHTPSGKPIRIAGQELSELKAFFTFEGEKTAANIVVNAALPAGEFGSYWYDLILDGEMVTRIPFKLLERQPVHEPQKQQR